MTKAFEQSMGILAKDEYYINEKHYQMEEKLMFASGDIAMKSDGKISSIKHFGIEMKLMCEGEQIAYLEDEINDVEGTGNTVMSMMKLFSAPWKTMAKTLGVKRNYYFSNLVPSSFYGVLIQAIALMIFPNNYNYFQHSLAGLQRSEDMPLCVGMASNMEELQKFYPEFKMEDLL